VKYLIEGSKDYKHGGIILHAFLSVLASSEVPLRQIERTSIDEQEGMIFDEKMQVAKAANDHLLDELGFNEIEDIVRSMSGVYNIELIYGKVHELLSLLDDIRTSRIEVEDISRKQIGGEK
jgi:hypothetical protein